MKSYRCCKTTNILLAYQKNYIAGMGHQITITYVHHMELILMKRRKPVHHT